MELEALKVARGGAEQPSMETIYIRKRSARCVLVAALVALLMTTGSAVASTGDHTDDTPAGVTVADATVGDFAGFAPGAEFLHLPVATRAADLDAMKATGAKWFRVGVQWSEVEQVRGEPRWSNVDKTLQLALERGLRPIVMVGYTPEWARPVLCSSRFCPPANPADFAKFVRMVVKRYAPFGVKTYEIWNEPNIANYWRPAPDPAAYTSLLRAAASAARSVDPTVTIVSAGLSPAANDRTSKITPSTFVSQMYAAGAGGSFDGLGMHPYALPVSPLHPRSWNAFYTLPDLYEIMVAHGDADKKIWMTEFAYATGNSQLSVTTYEQATYLAEAYGALMDAPWAGPLLWFNFRDRGQDPSDPEQNFGLVTWTGFPKPAHAAFVDMMKMKSPR